MSVKGFYFFAYVECYTFFFTLQRVRQYEIRKRLDEIYKVELVRRVKVIMI